MNPRCISSGTLIAILATAASLSGPAYAADVSGAGSSFVYPVISKWAAAYAEDTGNHVNYQSVGSSAGIAQIKAGTVDFGASDKPLDTAELDQAGLAQFPDVIGGIVPVIHLPGVRAGELVLDGSTLARIFLGEITRWNDAAIAALNPGLQLPDARINVVRRADGSGTTFNFTDYLSKVSSGWRDKVGTGTAVKWPTGIGGKGNDGVAAYVKQLPDAIGYVEYAYAAKNAIAWVRMQNAAGQVVQPNGASFQAAAASADWAGAAHFNLLMTNAPGAGAWPISATSWVMVPRAPKSPERARVVLDFFQWAYTKGQDDARALDYVPLPNALVQQVSAYWKTELKQ